MWQWRRSGRAISLYLNCVFCSILTGCASTGGNYNLGKADAQITSLQARYPELGQDLKQIKSNLSIASAIIAKNEGTIDQLTKMLDQEQDRSKSRLLWIWKLTSVILSLLLVVGTYIAWKLK